MQTVPTSDTKMWRIIRNICSSHWVHISEGSDRGHARHGSRQFVEIERWEKGERGEQV